MSSGGPLRAVLAAFDDGAGTLEGVSRTTGLDPQVVEAAVEHLIRSGHLSAQRLSFGCPAPGGGGCGGCVRADGGCDVPAHGSDVAHGGGHGAGGPQRRSGPVLVAFLRRRPEA